MEQMGKNSKNHELLHFCQNGTPYNAMEEEITKYICSLMVRESSSLSYPAKLSEHYLYSVRKNYDVIVILP